VRDETVQDRLEASLARTQRSRERRASAARA
jgi:hypothetical protein